MIHCAISEDNMFVLCAIVMYFMSYYVFSHVFPLFLMEILMLIM